MNQVLGALDLNRQQQIEGIEGFVFQYIEQSVINKTTANKGLRTASNLMSKFHTKSEAKKLALNARKRHCC